MSRSLLVSLFMLCASSAASAATSAVEIYGEGIFSGNDRPVESIRRFFDVRNIPRISGRVNSQKCRRSVDSYRREKTFVGPDGTRLEVRDVGPSVSIYTGCAPTEPSTYFRLDVTMNATDRSLPLSKEMSDLVYEAFGVSPDRSMVIGQLFGNLKITCRASQGCFAEPKPLTAPASR